MLFLTSSILMIADAVATYINVEVFKTAEEINPATKFLVYNYGWLPWLFFKIVVFPVAMAIALTIAIRRKSQSLLNTAISIMKATIVMYSFMFIFFATQVLLT